MANCPRCGTADFYPSFNGHGECVSSGCSLYVSAKVAQAADTDYEKIIDTSAWFHVTRSVAATEERGIAYTSEEDPDDYDTTIRNTECAVGILYTYMCGHMPTLLECIGVAQKLVDAPGVPLHTLSTVMPNMLPRSIDIWFLGRMRRLEAHTNTAGDLFFVVDG